MHCRWCGIGDETLMHIVNCGVDTYVENVEEIIHGADLQLMKEVAIRVENFLDRVEI